MGHQGRGRDYSVCVSAVGFARQPQQMGAGIQTNQMVIDGCALLPAEKEKRAGAEDMSGNRGHLLLGR